MAEPVRNLVVVSDLHLGCRLGLFPAGFSMRLDDGGTYRASRLQRIVWRWWEEFWGEWVPSVTRGEPFSVVINGDSVDGGAHHGNVTHISANLEDQERLALHVLKPVVDRAVRFSHDKAIELTKQGFSRWQVCVTRQRVFGEGER
jgi:hypothetical protein